MRLACGLQKCLPSSVKGILSDPEIIDNLWLPHRMTTTKVVSLFFLTSISLVRLYAQSNFFNNLNLSINNHHN